MVTKYKTANVQDFLQFVQRIALNAVMSNVLHAAMDITLKVDCVLGTLLSVLITVASVITMLVWFVVLDLTWQKAYVWDLLQFVRQIVINVIITAVQLVIKDLDFKINYAFKIL